jgi:hypothetical protein
MLIQLSMKRTRRHDRDNRVTVCTLYSTVLLGQQEICLDADEQKGKIRVQNLIPF